MGRVLNKKAQTKVFRSIEEFRQLYFPTGQGTELNMSKDPYQAGSRLATESLKKIRQTADRK